MQKIVPNLWFDKEAEQAAEFYLSVFEHGSIGNKSYYTEAGHEIHGQPAGQLLTIEFELEGLQLLGLNGGPAFKFNPSVSFLIACKTKEEVETLHSKLFEGGHALMELGEYPFSEKYAWIQDKYGLSWQIMYVGDAKITQKIVPTMMFVQDVSGKAEEAVKFYTSIFKDSSIGEVSRYEANEQPDPTALIKHADFFLAGQQFAAMDGGKEMHQFNFNEAISFLVNCETQEEIDYYWNKLSEGGDPKAQQCGWLKDKYGFAWQVSPTILDEMIRDKDIEKVKRVTNAFMKMKKFDIAELERAFEG